jgi:hypothetical protein
MGQALQQSVLCELYSEYVTRRDPEAVNRFAALGYESRFLQSMQPLGFEPAARFAPIFAMGTISWCAG